jgi:hypothetical protein
MTLATNSRMNFMEAEFDILDKDKSGDLDAKDLQQQSTLHVSIFTSVGKERLRAQHARVRTPMTKPSAARSLGFASASLCNITAGSSTSPTCPLA